MSAWEPGSSWTATRTVTQAQILAYAEVSGDHNPLHVDEAFARETPLGGTVAHGMLVFAWMNSLLATAFGQRGLEGSTVRVRFRAPARPGDELHLQVTIEGVALEPDQPPGVRARLSVTNQAADVVMDGVVSLP